MQQKNMAKADFVTSIGLSSFGLTILIMSIQMPRYESLGVNPYSVPGIVPGLLGLILLILGLVLSIRSIIRKGYQLGLTIDIIKQYFTEESTRNFLLALIFSLVYGVFLLTRIPYSLATGLYILFFILVFEYRPKENMSSQKKTILYSLVEAISVSAGVTLVFRYLFLVDLP
jgi:putative tricarboxylic transport membrane protein